MRLAFDLDGTLFDGPPGIYDDPHALRAQTVPHKLACARVTALHNLGSHIVYITGRGEHVREATTHNLTTADLPQGDLVMNRRWAGYEAMTLFKASALRIHHPTFYVGDHLADRAAAQIAEIPFIHADDWRTGVNRG